MTNCLQPRLSQAFLLFLLVLPAGGKVKSYNAGRLTDVALEEISFPVTLYNITTPVSAGTMYRFNVASEGVSYVAVCFSKTKRGYASDWTVHDPVEFRVDNDKLFLKRPNGKELRLLVLTKMRGSEHSTAPSASQDLHPSRQTIPECR